MILEIYFNKMKNNKLNNERNKLNRPFVYNTNNDIDDYIGIVEQKDTKLFNNLNYKLINEKKICMFKDEDNKFVNIQNSYLIKFLYKKFFLEYKLCGINLSTTTPHIIFEDSLGFGYNNLSINFPHYSDWCLSNKKGYDVPFSIKYFL
ncbi:hypothetical protein CPAV1605_748 [seawater metagenome]|uniref:Uncharacterized protein n=1 Tax=seawater metagenome TaxID=1561972 RepID=A0A5E8CI12_9ZZZZ